MSRNENKLISFLPGNNPISKRRYSWKERTWQHVSDSMVEFSRKYPYSWPPVFGEIKRGSDAAFNRLITVRPPQNTAINSTHVWMIDLLPIEQVHAFSEDMIEVYTKYKPKKWFIPNNLDEISKLAHLETELETRSWHKLGYVDPNPDINNQKVPLVDWLQISVYRCFPTHFLVLVEIRPSDLFRFTFKLLAGYDTPAGYTLSLPKLRNIFRFWGSRYSTREHAKNQLIEDLFLDLKWGTKKFLQKYTALGEFSKHFESLPPSIELFHVAEVGRMPYTSDKEARRNRFWDSLGMSRSLRGYSNERNTINFFPPEYLNAVNENPVIKILLNDSRPLKNKNETSEEYVLIDKVDTWVYGFARSFAMLVLGARLQRDAAKKWREFACRNKMSFLWKIFAFFASEEEISNSRFVLNRLVGEYSPQEEIMDMKSEGVPDLLDNLGLLLKDRLRSRFVHDFSRMAHYSLKNAVQATELVQKAGQELLQRELAKSNYFLAAMAFLVSIISIIMSLKK